MATSATTPAHSSDRRRKKEKTTTVAAAEQEQEFDAAGNLARIQQRQQEQQEQDEDAAYFQGAFITEERLGTSGDFSTEYWVVPRDKGYAADWHGLEDIPEDYYHLIEHWERRNGLAGRQRRKTGKYGDDKRKHEEQEKDSPPARPFQRRRTVASPAASSSSSSTTVPVPTTPSSGGGGGGSSEGGSASMATSSSSKSPAAAAPGAAHTTAAPAPVVAVARTEAAAVAATMPAAEDNHHNDDHDKERFWLWLDVVTSFVANDEAFISKFNSQSRLLRITAMTNAQRFVEERLKAAREAYDGSAARQQRAGIMPLLDRYASMKALEYPEPKTGTCSICHKTNVSLRFLITLHGRLGAVDWNDDNWLKQPAFASELAALCSPAPIDLQADAESARSDTIEHLCGRCHRWCSGYRAARHFKFLLATKIHEVLQAQEQQPGGKADPAAAAEGLVECAYANFLEVCQRAATLAGEPGQ